MKERFEIEQQEKQKRQKLLRTTFILFNISRYWFNCSFISNNMLFGIIFAVLTLVFVIGIIMSKSKEVDYSEAITDEIEEIKAQLAILDENYDLDFDLDEQYRIRDHWQQALKNKDIFRRETSVY